jgi:hypothetical protein
MYLLQPPHTTRTHIFFYFWYNPSAPKICFLCLRTMSWHEPEIFLFSQMFLKLLRKATKIFSNEFHTNQYAQVPVFPLLLDVFSPIHQQTAFGALTLSQSLRLKFILHRTLEGVLLTFSASNATALAPRLHKRGGGGSVSFSHWERRGLEGRSYKAAQRAWNKAVRSELDLGGAVWREA